MELTSHPESNAAFSSCISLAAASSSLFAIPGSIPGLEGLPPGCRFAPRCPIAAPKCRETIPELQTLENGQAACFYTDQTSQGNIWAREGR